MKNFLIIFPLICFPFASLSATINTFNLEQNIDYITNTSDFNGVILITQDDEVLYAKAKGISGEDQKALKLDSQFMIASLTKQITSTLVLKAYEKGKLSLQDPIGKYLTKLKSDWKDKVTIHDLLSNRSGITKLDKPLKFKPGTDFYYSNLGFTLLGMVLEKVENKKYYKLIEDLGKSCNMKNTIAPPSGKISYLIEKYPNLAHGYKYDTNTKSTYLSHFYHKRFYNPAGGLISNVNDLKNWNRCIWEGKIINKSSLKLMTTPYSITKRIWASGYGYAIQISEKNGIAEYSYTGFTSGYTSSLVYYPKFRLSVVIIENKSRHFKEKEQIFAIHSKIRNIIREKLCK